MTKEQPSGGQAQEGTSRGEGRAQPAAGEARDPSGKPTIDEPTGPALDLGPDEFDEQAEDPDEQSKDHRGG